MNPIIFSVKLKLLPRFFSFFFLFSLCINSCAQMQTRVQGDFYLGLLSKSNDQGSDTVTYFERALGSSNVYIRQAAAEELAGLMYEGTELSARTIERVRREAGGGWAAAFDAAGKTVDKDKVLAFLLGAEQEAGIPDEARFFILRECERQGIVFSVIESAAIDGRYASFRSRYNEALAFFRGFMEKGEWPERIPALFLQYTDLISELGRTFQYTASGNEGLNLFLQWENNLAGETALSVNSDEARYKLIFFAARNARRRGRIDEGVSLFERALTLAPDNEQADACIWYIMDSSSEESFDVFIQRLENCLPYLHDDSFLDDILERFLQGLISRQEWEKMLRLFTVIRDRTPSASTAACAWIIARAIKEGYLTDEQLRLAAETANVDEADPTIFLRIAYNAGDSNNISALYYRLNSASALGLPFLELPSAGNSKSKNKPSQALQFLLGFFDNGASELSLKFIRLLENDLEAGELRAVAQALAGAGMYAQSIRLVTMYTNREGYVRDRRDMELLFPRYHSESVERYAGQYNIDAPVLYALILTESAFQSGVVSSAGAIGLTQLMPDTAQEMAGRIRRAGGPDYTSTEDGLDLKNPDLNIHIGSYYINYLMGRFDDILLSLLSYNGGMNRVNRWWNSSPLPVDLFLETVAYSETRDYGRKVIAAAAVYQELYY
jgi:soluble lytic murein transglycosylase